MIQRLKYLVLQVIIATSNVRLAQLDRAFGYGPKGRGFESSNARSYMYLGEAEMLINTALPFFISQLRSTAE